jgi:ABC-type transporter Mla subunit MlaD
MKKLLVLLVILAAVWIGARYFAHRGEVHATIVFHSAGALHKGDPVTENGVEAGEVTKVAHLDGQDAVSVRLTRDHRRAIVSDSLFAIDGHTLVVSNTFAVGTPVDDGAVLRARDGKFAQWLARHGDKVAPVVEKMKRATDEKLDRLDADHLDAQLAEWKSKVPDWKSEGTQAFDAKLDVVKKRVAKIEDDLQHSNRAADARAVKEKFDKWIDEVRR